MPWQVPFVCQWSFGDGILVDGVCLVDPAPGLVVARYCGGGRGQSGENNPGRAFPQ